ncbi:uncharacterized protein LOC124162451 [Ischnura elegans]|uniref:uncharacterized protein LOC124162451 n=1 Tax=Ischnura elegans TaxID=197161 RepID=UPI001ED883FA|nr:uncharacterized protein LOC124162451 [Ischnura elegans]
MNRIQKLLYSEYCDFEDVVLLESPFAETTRDGQGVRQIQLGVTPSKLIIAEDYLRCDSEIEDSDDGKKIFFTKFLVSPDTDPDTETLELVSVIPIECVNLSVFHRRKKHTLKARLCNGQVLYFELGGFRNRMTLWNLWREKVKFLSPEEDGSSVSETSAASSSTCSSLYLLKTRSGVTSSGVHQIWNLYGKDSNLTSLQPPMISADRADCGVLKMSRQKWNDRTLFPTELGDYSGEIKHPFQEYGSRDLMERVLEEAHELESYDDSSTYSQPQWSLHSEVEINPISMEERREDPMDEKPLSEAAEGVKVSTKACLVNRFGEGVKENCGIRLYLYPLKTSRWDPRHSELLPVESGHYSSAEELAKEIDGGVEIWEQKRNSDFGKTKLRHFRRYGLMPCPQFNRAIGPFWEYLSKGDKHSVQSRLVASSTELTPSTSTSIDLPCPRNHLTATISYEALMLDENDDKILESCEELISKYPPAPLSSVPIFFWTTDLSFWPRPARDIYIRQRSILESIHEQISSLDQDYLKSSSKESTFSTKQSNSTAHNSFLSSTEKKERSTGERRLTHKIRHSARLQKEKGIKLTGYTDTLGKFDLRKTRKLLRLHVKLTAWDFNSATLAHQLTMIDKDLFLQIPVSELGILVNMSSRLLDKCFMSPLSSWQRAAPCFGAFVAFSHRVSCLVSSEVVKGETVKVRARLIARFINAANKCYQLQNFQSCQSILSGLQSPGIYRLHSTWYYVRLQHANKYEAFELLSKFFRDPRLLGHHHTFSRGEKGMPFIPSADFMLVHWLGIVPFGPQPAINPFEEKVTQKKKDEKTWITKGKADTDGRCERDMIKPEDTSFNSGIKEISSKKRGVRRFMSSFKIWPKSRSEKSKLSGEHGKSSIINFSEPQMKKSENKINGWLDRKAPELSKFFERVSENDEKIEAGNNQDYIYPWCSSSARFDEYRLEKIRKSAELLLASQYAASNYALFQSDLAREYLLKARYQELIDVYIESFQVEKN